MTTEKKEHSIMEFDLCLSAFTVIYSFSFFLGLEGDLMATTAEDPSLEETGRFLCL